AFINEAVRLDLENVACGAPPRYVGWYPRMVFQGTTGEFDPTIADVHTQPTDEAGSVVGHVLHVGTGAPRSAVITVDTCEGPRAYAGLVFAYHQLITKDFQRLTDQEWSAQLGQAPAADVPWLAPVLR